MSNTEKPVTVNLHITYADGKSIAVSLPDLLKALGQNKAVSTIGLSVTQNQQSLVATLSPDESDYPSITIDGVDKQNNPVYLTTVELPNADNPDAMTARLYAGVAEYETDEPIAFVRHKVDDPEFIQNHTRRKAAGEPVTKIVYVDTDAAQYRPWKGSENLPEHTED